MQPHVRLILREPALGDLEEIDRFSSGEFGAETSDAYARGLIGALDRIAAYPRSAPLRLDFGQGVRSMTYRSHRVLYELSAEGDVEVLRILHHSRSDDGALVPEGKGE